MPVAVRIPRSGDCEGRETCQCGDDTPDTAQSATSVTNRILKVSPDGRARIGRVFSVAKGARSMPHAVHRRKRAAYLFEQVENGEPTVLLADARVSCVLEGGIRKGSCLVVFLDAPRPVHRVMEVR